jgi:hypothetical protein
MRAFTSVFNVFFLILLAQGEFLISRRWTSSWLNLKIVVGAGRCNFSFLSLLL